ncbi:MAG: DUF1573 domain-containing protein [Muribaculaceae bacterium]|nr:DUF1573 domain-containing protein [Muribaculaceae bacterium]MDE5594430.1 DUF1573 domain-containing protein [Muribaculaceae bacterium]MDE6702337.1 DUF1573 domain-containing protein [Muribaculaceae bacterium]
MIKKLFLFLFMSVVAAGIAQAGGHDIEFAELTYDFGTVKSDNGPVTHDFVFTNTADVPVTVMSASVSCGCTRPKYSSEPVKPGKTGKITVSFLPKGQKGYISKNVKVRYKAAGKKTRSITIKITGNVVPE